jgi:hypothetical protein
MTYYDLLTECEYDPHRYQSTGDYVIAMWRLKEYLYYAANTNFLLTHTRQLPYNCQEREVTNEQKSEKEID